MSDKEQPYIEVRFSSPCEDVSIRCRTLLDTGAETTCIPEELVHALHLQVHDKRVIETVAGEVRDVGKYFVNVQIGNNLFSKHPVLAIPLKTPLIGWDILGRGVVLYSLMSRVFGQIIHVLGAIPSFKQRTVLVLGQDTTQIIRLQAIQDRLRGRGYTGIIVKDQADIEIQSIEEKVNMLASLCRFVICDNTFPSGHIDELKICSLNRFVTAILQEEGKGATWMQVDYPLDFSFMKIFKYSSVKQIDSAVNNAVKWAEKKIVERKAFFNRLYSWR